MHAVGDSTVVRACLVRSDVCNTNQRLTQVYYGRRGSKKCQCNKCSGKGEYAHPLASLGETGLLTLDHTRITTSEFRCKAKRSE